MIDLVAFLTLLVVMNVCHVKQFYQHNSRLVPLLEWLSYPKKLCITEHFFFMSRFSFLHFIQNSQLKPYHHKK